jgi:hypothetical protein
LYIRSRKTPFYLQSVLLAVCNEGACNNKKYKRQKQDNESFIQADLYIGSHRCDPAYWQLTDHTAIHRNYLQSA